MFEGHYTSSKWSPSPTWPKGMEICCGQMKEDWWRQISSRSLNILYPQALYEIWALLGKVERKYAWTMILHWEVSDLELWYKKIGARSLQTLYPQILYGWSLSLTCRREGKIPVTRQKWNKRQTDRQIDQNNTPRINVLHYLMLQVW